MDRQEKIQNMMKWANISEEELKEKGEYETSFGETLSWNYYEYVRNNPIKKWDSPTWILYGENDNLTERCVLGPFSTKNDCMVNVMPNGEHYFHTEEQLEYLDSWLRNRFEDGINGYYVKKGTVCDIDELGMLYDALNDYLSANTNYPGWIKGIYPIRKTAEKGIEEDSLYVLRKGNVIAGSIILNHEPEMAYKDVNWDIDITYDKILVVRTLVVHPGFMKQGVAKQLMGFTKELAVSSDIKSIRLDVSIDNIPAIKLYEQSGYKYIGTVDLGLPYEHLKWFRLYELVL